MRIPRIYLPQELSSNSAIELSGHSFQHTIKVLRMKQDAKLIVFDGKGHEYSAILQQINKKNALIEIENEIQHKTESNLKIHLGLGISKGERMDFAIQKAVELGVTEITPLFTEHCVVKLDEKRMLKRLQHWQGIIISACEQSGRNILPKLNPATSLIKWAEDMEINDICLIFSPVAKKSLQDVKPENDSINLLIGPEGGFSDSEIAELEKKSSFHSVKFGPRILRTETAALSAITAIQVLWGDLL